jgi:hypothetical protein
MEGRINKLIETYVCDFKKDIKNKCSELNIIQNNSIQELLTYIYDYNRLTVDKTDCSKRRRLKNSVPTYNRCCAIRAIDNTQCTRRRKEGSQFCGTHSKGTPNGIVTENNNEKSVEKIEIFGQEINGIYYYIDKNNNVYSMEDIMKNSKTPRVIAKCEKVLDEYRIINN